MDVVRNKKALNTIKLYNHVQTGETHWCINRVEAEQVFNTSRRQVRNYVFWNKELEHKQLKEIKDMVDIYGNIKCKFVKKRNKQTKK